MSYTSKSGMPNSISPGGGAGNTGGNQQQQNMNLQKQTSKINN